MRPPTLLFPLLILTSCANRPEIMVRPLTPPAIESSLRYGEVVREYHLGRYVDPHQPGVMHEQHPIYRVEADSRWDLRPGDPLEVNRLNPPPDSAYSAPPTHDVIIAEMNRQKNATERVMWEAFQLARSYDDLQKIIKDMTAVANNHFVMNKRIAEAELRVQKLEKQLINLVPTHSSNEAPSIDDLNETNLPAVSEPGW